MVSYFFGINQQLKLQISVMNSYGILLPVTTTLKKERLEAYMGQPEIDTRVRSALYLHIFSREYSCWC